MIAFFDASALIYLIDGHEPFARQVRRQLTAVSARYPDLRSAVSRLSWLECRVRPARTNDQVLLAEYDTFFGQPELLWVELTKDVVELATVIRATRGLRTPDSLQAASCLQLGTDHLFLTGDTGFKRVPGLNVKILT